ncbi:MAG: transporter, partial [Rariglobus sp.]|nr:transporter [Rariglobus sp.]
TATGSPPGTAGNTYTGVRLNINGNVDYTATQGTQTYDVFASGGEIRGLVVGATDINSSKTFTVSGSGANLIFVPDTATPASVLVGVGVGINYAGQASLVVNNGATLKVQTSLGVISGDLVILGRGLATATGTLTVGGTGTGTLVSSDTVTFGALTAPTAGATGTININSGGTLQTRKISAAANANNSSYATVNFNGGTLKSADTDNSEILLSGANSLAVKLLAGGGTIDTNGQTGQSITAVISGTAGGSFTKTGAGTLTLTAANTYNGTTLVTGGTLALGASGSISNSALIQVSSGATFDVSAQSYTLGAAKTLRGAGAVTGAVTMAGSSTIAGGVDAGTLGTLTFSGSLTSASGATFSLKLNSDSSLSDAIVASGLALNGATLSLTDLGSTTLSGPTTFTLFHSTSSSVTGTFAGLAEGASIIVGANTYTISYAANGGTDITLTASAIPEPATCAAVIGALTLLGAASRRRRPLLA